MIRLNEVTFADILLGASAVVDVRELLGLADWGLVRRPMLVRSKRLVLEKGEKRPRNDIGRLRFDSILAFGLSFLLGCRISGSGASMESPNGSNGVDGIG